MIYESPIIDIHKNVWNFYCEIEGSLEEMEVDPVGPDMLPHIGYAVGEYKISNIIISREDSALYIGSLALMPDTFSQRSITNITQDALEALEEQLKLKEEHE